MNKRKQGTAAERFAQAWYANKYPHGQLLSENWSIQLEGFRGELDFVYYTPTPHPVLHFVEVKCRQYATSDTLTPHKHSQHQQEALWRATAAITPHKQRQLHQLVTLFMLHFPFKEACPECDLARVYQNLEVCVVVQASESSYTGCEVIPIDLSF